MNRVLRLPGCYPLVLEAGHSEQTYHGACSTPKVIAAKLVRVGACAPSAGLRLWVYLRGGFAFFVTLYVDRRSAA